MHTLNLKEASNILKMTPEALRKKISKGEIPAAKIGKSWLFIKDDLVDFMRSRYSKSAETSWGVVQTERRTKWHSTKERKSGGSILAMKEREYRQLVGLPIK